MTYIGQLATGGVVLLAYLVIMLFAGSNYIRGSNRKWLAAHEAAFQGRMLADSGGDGVEAAVRHLLEPTQTGKKSSIFSANEWIGFCEIAGWVRLHEAQRLEISLMTDTQVQARFARAMGQVDELPAIRQSAWQRRWTDLQSASNVTADRWRDELSQLLAELFNARDSTYNQLVSLYGKAGWLVVAAYLPVAALLVAGYGPVLLAGFLGGLISRMQRLVYGRGRPTAYGASWVPLFLAPLLGALAAWAGLHLLSLLQGMGVVSLTGVLPPGADFRMDPGASVLGLAVLLGFSERLFNQLGDQANKVLSGEQDTGSPATAGSTTSSFGPAPVDSIPATRRPADDPAPAPAPAPARRARPTAERAPEFPAPARTVSRRCSPGRARQARSVVPNQ